MQTLIGPFSQIVSLDKLSLKGSLSNDQLTIIEQGAVVVDHGKIVAVRKIKDFDVKSFRYELIEHETVLLPGLIDCHTHMIWGGSRARDYTMRMEGRTYQEILASGGGIFDSVSKTQQTSDQDLLVGLLKRADRHIHDGVTTIEVKTGYGLLPDEELRLLKIIKEARTQADADLIATCLAAHVCPTDFENGAFLEHLTHELLPEIRLKGLAQRVDIFVEDHAFPANLAKAYLVAARKQGFQLAIHADQFTTGGSQLAVELEALSADHLEASGDREIEAMANSDVVAVALPGASLGLGMGYTPARRLLDAGANVAIATDWNPGSAPMGDLLVQASLLGIYEKLSAAELIAGVTYRSAAALGLKDRGRLASNEKADMIGFPCSDYREIFYQQGRMKPSMVWKNGKLI
ncbi:MAG: imidazolonepropionase [Cyclobacteriaceae bacterium]